MNDPADVETICLCCHEHVLTTDVSWAGSDNGRCTACRRPHNDRHPAWWRTRVLGQRYVD